MVKFKIGEATFHKDALKNFKRIRSVIFLFDLENLPLLVLSMLGDSSFTLSIV